MVTGRISFFSPEYSPISSSVREVRAISSRFHCRPATVFVTRMSVFAPAFAIAAAPTMVAGIYGMNFDNMPELHYHYGYFVVLGVLLVTMVGLAVGFRRNHWL